MAWITSCAQRSARPAGGGCPMGVRAIPGTRWTGKPCACLPPAIASSCAMRASRNISPSGRMADHDGIDRAGPLHQRVRSAGGHYHQPTAGAGLSALMGDLAAGRITNGRANSICNAAGKILTTVKLEQQYGEKGSGGPTLELIRPEPGPRAIG